MPFVGFCLKNDEFLKHFQNWITRFQRVDACTFFMIMPSTRMTVTDRDTVGVTDHQVIQASLWEDQKFQRETGSHGGIFSRIFRESLVAKGRVLLRLAGSLTIEIADRPRSEPELYGGDGDPPHRSSTVTGAKLFIND